jgi:large subunit ribosomal protein L19
VGDVSRAKLYYLRGRVGKKARVREKRYGAGGTLDQQAAAKAQRTLQATEAAPGDTERGDLPGPEPTEPTAVEETAVEETAPVADEPTAAEAAGAPPADEPPADDAEAVPAAEKS